MKRTALIAALCLIGLLSGCNSDKKQIKEAAMGYLNATGNYLIDEAMPYASKETREVTLPFLRDKLIPLTPKEYIESNTPATIDLGDITINDDTAMVCYTKHTPIKELEGEIHLVREEGKWLVYVPLVLPESIVLNGSDADTAGMGLGNTPHSITVDKKDIKIADKAE